MSPHVSNGKIHELSGFLEEQWLKEVNVDDLLFLLREEVLQLDHLVLLGLRVEATPITSKIINSYNKRQKGTYKTEKGYTWLRAIGDKVVHNQQTLLSAVFLGIINGIKHWVPLVISEGGKKICYGDSLGFPIPSKLHNAFAWWLQQHDPAVAPSLQSLPITSQIDDHSCGILTINSLRHFVNPCEHKLLSGHKTSIVMERLKAFNTISNKIIKHVRIIKFIKLSQ